MAPFDDFKFIGGVDEGADEPPFLSRFGQGKEHIDPSDGFRGCVDRGRLLRRFAAELFVEFRF